MTEGEGRVKVEETGKVPCKSGPQRTVFRKNRASAEHQARSEEKHQEQQGTRHPGKSKSTTRDLYTGIQTQNDNRKSKPNKQETTQTSKEPKTISPSEEVNPQEPC